MRKGKLLSGRAWKRIVRVLSCIVVFCTTYALILPAITQEAQAYCGSEEHQHTEECYRDIESCPKEEHRHAEDCYDADGNLICQQEEHTHSEECTWELLDCTREEHTHTLQCFSNPEADLETEEDWKKTVPTEDELKDKTVREQIVMIAQSQKGYKESDKNYQVENETEKKGITRYGQWDQDPYEDWTSAYVRFVLHHAGVDTADAKKSASDWLEQLHQAEALKNAEEAEPGDVLFVYDSSDHLRTGIVEEKMDSTIKALIGDWDNEVKEQSFNAADESVHSIWKPLAADQKPEEIPTGPDQPEEPKPEEEAKPEDKDEQPAEKSEEEPVVTYDFTQEVEAEDGAKIKVSWNAGTFETEDVVFQAKKVELTEEEQKKVQEQLDQDKSYTFRNYDLTFYVRNESMELVKVEPIQPVHVEIEFGEEISADEKPEGLVHLNDDGFADYIPSDDSKQVQPTDNTGENQKQQTIEILKQTNSIMEFKSKDFSKYSVVFTGDWEYCGSMYSINQAIGQGKRKIRLSNSISNDNQTININSDNSSTSDPVVIDTAGYQIQSSNIVINIYTGGQCVITNSANVSVSPSAYDKDFGLDAQGHSFVKYGSNGNITTVTNVGLIHSTNNNAIRIYHDNSQLQIEKGVAVISNNNRGIYSDEGKTRIYLDKTYVCHSKGGIALHNGATLLVNDGTVISDNNADKGGGIYADSTFNQSKIGSSVILNDGCLIANNTAEIGGGISIGQDGEFGEGHDAASDSYIASISADQCSKLIMYGGIIQNNSATVREGGGIALLFNSSARAVLYAGQILNNRTTSTNANHRDWGGGGIFSSQGTFLMMPNGADIYGNTSDGLGGGLTGCSTGKILIDSSLNIYGNTANGSRFTAGSDKQKDQRVNPGGHISNNDPYPYDTTYREGDYWKGADVFGAETTQVSTSGNVTMKGIADGDQITVPGGGTVRTSDWLVLTDVNGTGSGTAHQLKITGNTSTTHGGGVLINGWLVNGEFGVKVLGDDVGVIANKPLTDLSGNHINPDGKDFKFTIQTETQPGKGVVATGYVAEDGRISFSNRLVIQPDGTEDSFTKTYYLMEDTTSLSEEIIGDQTVYELKFNGSCTSTTTMTMPKWNPETETFTTETVTVKEYSVDRVEVKKLGENESVLITDFAGSLVKNIDLSNIDGNSTFSNKAITRKDIKVVKTWEDGSDKHLKDHATVYLT